MARPPKLTPEVQEAICTAIEVSGMRPDEAGPLVGVGASTVREWLQRGRGEHPTRKATAPYAAFAAAVDTAEARLKRAVLTHWRSHMPTSAAACRDFMGRRWPEWGEVQRFAPTTPDGSAPYEGVDAATLAAALVALGIHPGEEEA